MFERHGHVRLGLIPDLDSHRFEESAPQAVDQHPANLVNSRIQLNIVHQQHVLVVLPVPPLHLLFPNYIIYIMQDTDSF